MANGDASTEFVTKIAALGAGDKTTLLLAALKAAWAAAVGAAPTKQWDLTTVYRDKA
jgi:hypothetical protein